MSPDPKVSVVAYVIQLSVAPVFLLSGVSVTLSVLTNRLARIIDRARKLEERVGDYREELKVLSRRAMCIHRAITQSVTCSILICCVIVTLFISAFYTIDLSRWVAGIFVAAIAVFVGALVSFLREIFIATKSLRFEMEQSAERAAGTSPGNAAK